MTLEMYINGKWVDSTPLSLCKIGDPEERQLYIQGAANDLMEKWEDLLEDQELEVAFFIRGQFRF